MTRSAPAEFDELGFCQVSPYGLPTVIYPAIFQSPASPYGLPDGSLTRFATAKTRFVVTIFSLFLQVMACDLLRVEKTALMKIFNRIPEHWIPLLSLLGAVIGWGWAWVGIRDAVRFYEPGQLALGRYCVASLTLLPFWLSYGGRWPSTRDWKTIAIMGITGFSFYNVCINHGEQTITAGTAALIGCCLPILTTLGAWCFFREKLNRVAWIGIVTAFAGVAITTLGAHGGIQLSHGALLVFLAMVSAAIYGLLTKKMVARYTPLEITTWSIWAGTIALIPFGSGVFKAVTVVPWQATLNMILLGILPGAISYALYSFAIARMRMASVSSCVFLMPVTSIILGWCLLGELPSWLAFVGGAVTLGGAYLVNAQKKEKK